MSGESSSNMTNVFLGTTMIHRMITHGWLLLKLCWLLQHINFIKEPIRSESIFLVCARQQSFIFLFSFFFLLKKKEKNLWRMSMNMWKHKWWCVQCIPPKKEALFHSRKEKASNGFVSSNTCRDLFMETLLLAVGVWHLR